MMAEAAATDWIEWNGGECPVDADALVEVELRMRGQQGRDEASTFDWSHIPDDAGQDIIAYRVVSA